MDPFEALEIACEFPFTSGAFDDLRRYVRAVHEFLPHSSAQQSIRIEAKLKGIDDPVRTGELEHELDVIAQDAQTTLPRIVWGGVLISIYAAYENATRTSMNHWQSTTKYPEPFRPPPGRDFLKFSAKYAQVNLHVDLFGDAQLRKKLFELKALRNSFVHTGGLLASLPETIAADIATKRHLGVSLEVQEDRWVGNARCAAYYLQVAEKATKYLEFAILGEVREYFSTHPREA
jgi:hypothetical protein